MSEDNVKLNRDYIGKEYTCGPYHIEPESIRKYALATNENNPRYIDPASRDGLVPSPIFPVVFLPDLLSQLVEDAEGMNLNILRAVHAEQEMSWYESLHPGDKLDISAEIVDMKQYGVNDLLDLKILYKRDKSIVLEMGYRLMVRGKKKSDDSKSRKSLEEPEKGNILAERTIVVTEDQGERYAEASGDLNPIHVNEEVAKSVGLPGTILHGLCTMAFASQTIVDEILDGNPSRMKNMRVRFSKPVFMKDALTTTVFDAGTSESGNRIIRFETRNADGDPVLTRGVAEIEK
ncbi:MAG: MaoC/PaaZ C-terminal domain-containing protein [Candidatus Thorarchaeota archaeon]